MRNIDRRTKVRVSTVQLGEADTEKVLVLRHLYDTLCDIHLKAFPSCTFGAFLNQLVNSLPQITYGAYQPYVMSDFEFYRRLQMWGSSVKSGSQLRNCKWEPLATTNRTKYLYSTSLKSRSESCNIKHEELRQLYKNLYEYHINKLSDVTIMTLLTTLRDEDILYLRGVDTSLVMPFLDSVARANALV